MGFKVLETAARDEHLDHRLRDKPLPDGVKVCLAEATGTGHGYHHPGDRWVEYFYENAKAERAHYAQRMGTV